MSLYTDHLAKYKSDLVAPDHIIEKIINAKHFIDSNYHHDISLREISRASLISKFHFIRLFRKTYGRTPNQYLVETRIANAKLILKKGYKVSDACVAVGFNSITTFTSLYKKTTGMSPAHFKRLRAIKKSNSG
jgi:AraC-like DNA-binding protein